MVIISSLPLVALPRAHQSRRRTVLVMPGERKASTNSHPYPPYQSLDRPGKHTVRDECGRVSLALSLDSTHRGFSAMLHPETGLIATPPTKEPPAKDLENMEAAIQQARLGLEEGGIPIGGALVRVIERPPSECTDYPRGTHHSWALIGRS